MKAKEKINRLWSSFQKKEITARQALTLVVVVYEETEPTDLDLLRLDNISEYLISEFKIN